MVFILSEKTLLALLPYFLQVGATVSGSASGSGTTTRYWDCCKASCAWPGKTTLASGATPVAMCSIDGTPISDSNVVSGCDGGSAYTCSDNSPWVDSSDSSLAYGYAAVSISGGSEDSWCCACYEITFTSTAIAGKKMIVQATNTGSDLSKNQFDLLIPGGGVGIYNGCTAQWGAPSSGWGAQYGGISSASLCATFPTALRAGCEWRYDWFEGADNPTVNFVQVECPAVLTAKTGCVRAGEVPTGGSSASSSSAAPSSTSSAASSAATTSSTTTTTSVAVTSPTSSSSSSSTVAAATSSTSSSSSASIASATLLSSTTTSQTTAVAETTSFPTSSSTTLSTATKTTSLIIVTVTASPGSFIPPPPSDTCDREEL